MPIICVPDNAIQSLNTPCFRLGYPNIRTASIPCSQFVGAIAQRPSGLLAVPPPLPEPPERPGTPGRLAMDAIPPTPLVLKPRGFLFVVDRLPGAPVMSLRELPYSRTISPQVRDEFAILRYVSQKSRLGKVAICTLLRRLSLPQRFHYLSRSRRPQQHCQYQSLQRRQHFQYQTMQR